MDVSLEQSGLASATEYEHVEFTWWALCNNRRWNKNLLFRKMGNLEE